MTKYVMALSEGLAEPNWLTKRRLLFRDKMAELELARIDRIKYQRWPLIDEQVTLVEPTGAVPDFLSKEHLPHMVQVSGAPSFESLPASWRDAGVVFTPFSQIDHTYEAFLEKELGTIAEVNRLTAYNTAYFNGSAFLYIPENMVLDEAIQGLFLHDVMQQIPWLQRLVIHVGKHASVSFVERMKAIGTADKEIIANIVVEMVLEEGASVKYATIDQLGEKVTAYIHRRVKVGKNAHLDWSQAFFNEGRVVIDHDVDLAGEGSYGTIKAVALSSDKQIQAIDTRMTNKAPFSISHILQHGVILDKGRVTFNGIGHIENGAKNADAQQESRVLMLSDKARSDANPILLIDENEVTAGHAASIGQIDAEDLYYLMSRGLTEDEAKGLIVRGFLATVLGEIPVDAVRDEMIAILESRLEGAED